MLLWVRVSIVASEYLEEKLVSVMASLLIDVRIHNRPPCCRERVVVGWGV